MRYHTLLSEPTFLYYDKDILLDPDIKGDSRASGIFGLLFDTSDPNTKGLNYRNVTDALGLYVRRMLSSCACIVRLPSYGPSMWASPKQLKSHLSQRQNTGRCFQNNLNNWGHTLHCTLKWYVLWEEKQALDPPIHWTDKRSLHKLQSESTDDAVAWCALHA